MNIYQVKIQAAYQAEKLLGSYLTAPLKSYEKNWVPYFTEKMQQTDECCSGLVWKVCFVVSKIFATVVLGSLAVVGIAINAAFIQSDIDTLVISPRSGNNLSGEK